MNLKLSRLSPWISIFARLALIIFDKNLSTNMKLQTDNLYENVGHLRII